MGLTAVTLGNGREDPHCGDHGSSCFNGCLVSPGILWQVWQWAGP